MVKRILNTIFGSKEQQTPLGEHRCYAAYLYDEEEEYLEEIDRLSGLIAKDQADFVALNNRGILHWELGNTKDALRDLSAACDHAIHESLPHENAARFFEKHGARDKAIEAYMRALRIDSRSSTTNSALGEIYLAEKDFIEAANCYSRAIETRKDFAHFYRQRANAYEGLGKTDEAAEDRAKAKHIDP